MLGDYVDVHRGSVHPPVTSKKKKARKKSTDDLKISTDFKQDLNQKTEGNCVKFLKTFCCVESWKKCCPCLRTEKQRKLQAKRGVALFCLCMYSYDVGSDLAVGFDLLNKCHELTGNISFRLIRINSIPSRLSHY